MLRILRRKRRVCILICTVTAFSTVLLLGQLKAPDPHTMKKIAGVRDTPALEDPQQDYGPLKVKNGLHKLNQDTVIAEENIAYERSDYKAEKVPRNIEYCNSPLGPVSGSEGTIPEGYHLKLAHVFIRHGDRSPMNAIERFTQPLYSCVFPNGYGVNSDPKLSSYMPTMKKFTGKQSKKSYYLNWSLMPNKDECDESELTGIGAVQHVKTGMHFYNKYISSSVLLDNKLALSSQIYTRSTGMSRTYQSAVAFLYGLLPVSAFNVTSLTIDQSLSMYFCLPEHALKKSCVCEQSTSLSYRIKTIENESNKNSNRFREIVKKITDIFELTPSQVLSTSILLDMFVPPLCHNYTVPCNDWSSSRCLNGEIYQNLWAENSHQCRMHLTDHNQTYSKFSNIMLTPLMVEVAHRMKDALEGRTTPKLVLYSGHDFTLSPLLYVLGIYHGEWTPYASRIVIELYESKDRTINNNHMLKFLYNGKDVTEMVSFCRGKTYNGMCHFRLFYEHVFTKMLQQFGYTSYEDACLRAK